MRRLLNRLNGDRRYAKKNETLLKNKSLSWHVLLIAKRLFAKEFNENVKGISKRIRLFPNDLVLASRSRTISKGIRCTKYPNLKTYYSLEK